MMSYDAENESSYVVNVFVPTDTVVQRKRQAPSSAPYLQNVLNTVSYSKSKVTSAVFSSTAVKRSRTKTVLSVPDEGNEQEMQLLSPLSDLRDLPDPKRMKTQHDDTNISLSEVPVCVAHHELPNDATRNDRTSLVSLALLPSPSAHFRLHNHIEHLVRTWGDKMKHIHPSEYLQHLLTTRGYDNQYIEALDHRKSIYGYMQTEKQVEDYDCDIVNAVRLSDLDALQVMYNQGKSMSACNRYSESVLHMACRRSSYETIRFMLDKVDTLLLVDDFGRTPLHDACWRPEPHFAIVALLLDVNFDLLRCKDKRGSTPLDYVRKDHWPYWCAFLDCQKDKYWARRSNSVQEAPPSKNPCTSSASGLPVTHDASQHITSMTLENVAVHNHHQQQQQQLQPHKPPSDPSIISDITAQTFTSLATESTSIHCVMAVTPSDTESSHSSTSDSKLHQKQRYLHKTNANTTYETIG